VLLASSTMMPALLLPRARLLLLDLSLTVICRQLWLVRGSSLLLLAKVLRMVWGDSWSVGWHSFLFCFWFPDAGTWTQGHGGYPHDAATLVASTFFSTRFPLHSLPHVDFCSSFHFGMVQASLVAQKLFNKTF